MISRFVTRRSILALPFAAACTTRRSGLGYAFVANEEGHAIAAVDLDALAVARHIPLDGAPVEVLALKTRPSVYALTTGNGAIHEIRADRLSFARKLAIGFQAISMHVSPDEQAIYVLTREPKALVRVALDPLAVDWKLSLPEAPRDFAISSDGETAVVSAGQSVRFIDLAARRLGKPLGPPADIGTVRFLKESPTMIAADRGERMLSLYDATSSKLITHLPVPVRPDNLCFNSDGGQLFVTGEGVDGVVIVYPFHTPEVDQTVLVGHAPGAMAASGLDSNLLFIASPQSGDVSILSIGTHKVIAVQNVGSDPGFIAVTPGDEYALVLNRKSGDVAVLRVEVQQNRYKEQAGKLLTVIPVGSRPVSAAVRRV